MLKRANAFKGIDRFYNQKSDTYEIPLRYVDDGVSELIMKKLSEGYIIVGMLDEDGGYETNEWNVLSMIYILARGNNGEYVNNLRTELCPESKRYVQKMTGVPYGEVFNVYFENEAIAEKVDRVLFGNTIQRDDGCLVCIGMTVVKGSLAFVEWDFAPYNQVSIGEKTTMQKEEVVKKKPTTTTIQKEEVVKKKSTMITTPEEYMRLSNLFFDLWKEIKDVLVYSKSAKEREIGWKAMGGHYGVTYVPSTEVFHLYSECMNATYSISTVRKEVHTSGVTIPYIKRTNSKYKEGDNSIILMYSDYCEGRSSWNVEGYNFKTHPLYWDSAEEFNERFDF